MKTRTVAYRTQMVSNVRTMPGCRHQGSLRSVFSAICARVLAGDSIACVILDVLAACCLCVAPDPAVPRRPRMRLCVHELIPVDSQILPLVTPHACDPCYTAIRTGRAGMIQQNGPMRRV